MATGPKTAFFTIAAWNYLHYARSLAASIAEHHGDIPCFLAVADAADNGPGADQFPEFDHAIAFDDLGLPDASAFSFRYDVLEFSTALKPSVFLHLFAKGYDRVIYLDPDIVVHRRFDEVFRALDGGASTVLTPHALAPNLHLEGPNDLNFLQSGVYNLGFMALRQTPETLATLEWWQTRLRTECVTNRVEHGLFSDQKFVDLWPAYCPDTHILRDPSYNVAYWNLDSRTIRRRGDAYEVNGVPLAFFHFSGIVPGDRAVLSKYQRRWSPESSPELHDLLHGYHDRLEHFGRRRFSAIPYGFGSFADGAPIPREVRHLFREELEPFDGDPFTALPALLNEAAELAPNPGGAITRLAHSVWKRRPDLHSQFGLDSGVLQMRYADWFASGGAAAAGIPECFIAPVRQRLAAAVGGPLSRIAGGSYRALMRLRPHITRLYAPVPPAWRRRLLHGLLQAAWPSSPALAPGVSLIGYPFAEIGMGESLRSLAGSVETAGIDYEVVNHDAQLTGPQNDRTLQARLVGAPGRAVNIFCVNADMLASTLHGVGPAATHGRFNIVRPFWELSRLHPDWDAGLQQVDEIWATTTFIRDAFAAGTDVPVLHMPMAVSVPAGVASDRRRFGIPPDATAFLFAFDFSSYPARKNPRAVLEAYRLAFGNDLGVPVALVIKTMGQSPQKAEILASVRRLAERDPRIIVIDEVLSRADMHRLTASCDVFVSLHRSEGFGLGIAEAMAMGKAVVATDYSGSTDFVTAATGFPVPYALVPVGPDDYPYFIDGQHWADPDIEAAARIMARLAADPALRTRIGAAAQHFMATTHSHEAVGHRLATRLAQLTGS